MICFVFQVALGTCRMKALPMPTDNDGSQVPPPTIHDEPLRMCDFHGAPVEEDLVCPVCELRPEERLLKMLFDTPEALAVYRMKEREKARERIAEELASGFGPLGVGTIKVDPATIDDALAELYINLLTPRGHYRTCFAFLATLEAHTDPPTIH
jgi:hypothetical protein